MTGFAVTVDGSAMLQGLVVHVENATVGATLTGGASTTAWRAAAPPTSSPLATAWTLLPAAPAPIRRRMSPNGDVLIDFGRGATETMFIAGLIDASLALCGCGFQELTVGGAVSVFLADNSYMLEGFSAVVVAGGVEVTYAQPQHIVELVDTGLGGGIMFRGSGGPPISGGSQAAGWSVSIAGDVNGDGFDDVLIGALGTYRGYYSGAGAMYVVFGNNGTLPTTPQELADFSSSDDVMASWRLQRRDSGYDMPRRQPCPPPGTSTATALPISWSGARGPMRLTGRAERQARLTSSTARGAQPGHRLRQ